MSVNATQPPSGSPRTGSPSKESTAEGGLVEFSMPKHDFQGAFLSPDELIDWVSRHLGDIDGRIRTLVGDVNERKQQAAEYQRALGRIDLALKGKDADPKKAAKTFRDLEAATPDGPIKDAYTEIAKAFEKKAPLSNARLGALKQQLTANMEELTGSAEITMLNVQKLVTERGHLLSLATNLLKAADDAAKATLNNLR